MSWQEETPTKKWLGLARGGFAPDAQPGEAKSETPPFVLTPQASERLAALAPRLADALASLVDEPNCGLTFTSMAVVCIYCGGWMARARYEDGGGHFDKHNAACRIQIGRTLLKKARGSLTGEGQA